MADLILRERKPFGEDSFVEFRIYSVPKSKLFPEGVKYSLGFVVEGVCVLRYDNERGKGHHRHFKREESSIKFKSPKQLMKRFLEEVEKIREGELQ